MFWPMIALAIVLEFHRSCWDFHGSRLYLQTNGGFCCLQSRNNSIGGEVSNTTTQNPATRRQTAVENVQIVLRSNSRFALIHLPEI